MKIEIQSKNCWTICSMFDRNEIRAHLEIDLQLQGWPVEVFFTKVNVDGKLIMFWLYFPFVCPYLVKKQYLSQNTNGISMDKCVVDK